MVTITFGTIGRHHVIQSAKLPSKGRAGCPREPRGARAPAPEMGTRSQPPLFQGLARVPSRVGRSLRTCRVGRTGRSAGRSRGGLGPRKARGVDVAPRSRYTPRFPVWFPASARESRDVWSWESQGTFLCERVFGDFFWSPDGGIMVSPPPVECLLQGIPESLARVSAVIVARREVRCRIRSSNS